MGIPWEKISVARNARFFFSRSSMIFGSSVGPSTPQFQLLLSFAPSRLSSPFSSLCLLSYDTRSLSEKPSWQVMKLMLACGRRPLHSYRSLEPLIRVANSEAMPPSPFQKRRTVSRYFPFHSDHNAGKLPTWYPPSPRSHGSAI